MTGSASRRSISRYRLRTHDGCGLGSLNGQAVGLDWGTRAGLLGGLVLALHLGVVSSVLWKMDDILSLRRMRDGK